MKPFYSIQELSDILDEDIYTIADALSASGVKLQQDLSRWSRPIIDHGNGSITIITGRAIVPDPRIVIVSTDFLPESWRKYIEILGDSTVQQENDPSLSAANSGGSSTDLPPALSSSSCESQPEKEIVRTERARSKLSTESDSEQAAKVEARLPALQAQVEPEGSGMNFEETLAAMKAESERVENLSLQEKTQRYRKAIEQLRERCSKPPEPDRPGLVPGLSASIHAVVVASSRYRIADMEKEIERASRACGIDVETGKQSAQESVQQSAQESAS